MGGEITVEHKYIIQNRNQSDNGWIRSTYYGKPIMAFKSRDEAEKYLKRILSSDKYVMLYIHGVYRSFRRPEYKVTKKPKEGK